MDKNFIDFIKSESNLDNNFKDITPIFHNDIKSFKKVYDNSYGKLGIKIHKFNDSLKLHVGFVMEKVGSVEWHTTTLSIFKYFEKYGK